MKLQNVSITTQYMVSYLLKLEKVLKVEINLQIHGDAHHTFLLLHLFQDL